MSRNAVFVGTAVVLLALLGVFLLFQQRVTTQPADGPVLQEAASPAAEPAAPPVEAQPDALSAAPEDAAPAEEEESLAFLRVYGTVTEAATGAPVADATLSCEARRERRGPDDEAEEAPEELPDAATDADGAYSLELPAKWVRALECRAAGFARGSKRIEKDAVGSLRLDFALEPGALVAGRVADASTGEGIAGARVSAVNASKNLIEALRDMDEQSERKVECDDGGYYRLDGLVSASYRIAVRATEQGYLFTAQQVQTVDLPEGAEVEGVDFALELGGVVTGVLVTPESEPVTDARVSAMPVQVFKAAMDAMSSPETAAFGDLDAKTSEAGEFTIKAIPFDAPYRVRTDPEGFAQSTSEHFTIRRGDASPFVRLVVTRGSVVSGILVDQNGAPVPDRRLWLWPRMSAMLGGESTPESEETGEDGAFEFVEVARGSYQISTDREPMMQLGPGMGSGLQIEVDGINDITGLKVPLPEPRPATAWQPGSGIITGKVIAPSGAPVPDVRVEAKRSDMPHMTGGAATGKDGAFAITRLDGMAYDLSVKCDLGVGSQAAVPVGSDVELRLAAPARVSGVVVDSRGQPVASCKVGLVDTAPKQEAANPMLAIMSVMFSDGFTGISTNDVGFFQFENVSPGEYRLKARDESKGTAEQGPIAVAAGQDVTGVRIVLDPGISFSGTVECYELGPLEGANVRLSPQTDESIQDLVAKFLPPGLGKNAGSATTDGAGEFTITRVPPGVYSVITTCPGFSKSVQSGIELTSGRDVSGHRIELGRGGRVRGQALVDGQPLANGMVYVMGDGGFDMVTTDSTGQFDISGLAPGEYAVMAIDLDRLQNEGLTSMDINPRMVEIEEGAESEVDFSPGSGWPVDGIVTGELGSMTTVSLRRPGGPDPATLDPFDIGGAMDAMRYSAGQSFVGSDGTFNIDGVEPGTYILEVYSVDMDLQNPDLTALMNMDRSPRLRQEVTIGEEPLNLNLAVPPSGSTP